MLKIKKSFMALVLTAAISYGSAVFAMVPIAKIDFISKDGYSIKYPKGWTAQEQNGNYGIAFFKSPMENSTDNYLENTSVVVEKVPGYTTEQYYEDNVKAMAGTNKLKDFKVIQSGSKIINGNTTRYLVYTHTANNIPLRAKAYFFSNGKNGFVVTSTAKATAFGSYLITFETIAGSFKL